MSKHLARDLREVEGKILAMSSLVEEMIERSIQSLRERKPDLARKVIDADREVDEREVQIEEECLKILALHQPVAIDLRRTAAVMKINNDLERIADLAVNVAESSLRLEPHRQFQVPSRLHEMVELAKQMVHDALDDFVRLDTVAAGALVARDEEVDACSIEVIAELYQVMRTRPELIEPALHCFSMARHIERIADHATNIAEDVIYLVKGDITRHRHLGPLFPRDAAPTTGTVS